MREETLRLNAERDEQIIALQREEKQMANRFGRKTPSYCTGPRTRRRARSGSGYGANGRDTDGASSILSVDSYGSTSNSNWVTDRTAQFPANGERFVKFRSNHYFNQSTRRVCDRLICWNMMCENAQIKPGLYLTTVRRKLWPICAILSFSQSIDSIWIDTIIDWLKMIE